MVHSAYNICLQNTFDFQLGNTLDTLELVTVLADDFAFIYYIFATWFKKAWLSVFNFEFIYSFNSFNKG